MATTHWIDGRESHLLRRVWESITEPRRVKVIYAIGYLVCLLGGLATLLVPPNTIANELGPALAVIWSVSWIIAGALGIPTVLSGWWQMERLANYAAMVGCGIYGSVLGVLHVTMDGSRLTQISMLLLAVLFFILRLALIRDHDYEPRR